MGEKNIHSNNPYYVYMVECVDGTFYCGISQDTAKRVEKHNIGKGSKYAASRRPVKLVYFAEVENKSVALKEEYRIKKLSRKQKLILISKDIKKVNFIK